ncbi:siphovirus ReqiPepy6 Gp37-like family protein [Actinoplanes sp. NPDC049548]|uniref:siphovirus ReqiPepy6 Gp37-like family protein n=1 Tax=Actinoplanes sp. NPDC049548 TaxID=3155152 RepID=UPI003420E818
MKLDDITVEVRNRNLDRVGQIRPDELDLTIQDVFNNVGQWTLKLAAEHPLADVLRSPGSGIIVTGPTDVLLSGPVVEPRNEATATDPVGTVTIAGVTDAILLADALAYPDPAVGDPTAQKAPTDLRIGEVEALMHEFVNANIGPGAPASRRTGLLGKLTMGENGRRGPVTTKSARFTVLGTLLSELASTANLGFRVVQRGNRLAFETYAVRDRTDLIRLDIFNSTLAGHKVAISPPGATRVLVGGSDEGVFRQFVVRTNTAAAQAEQDWGRRIEVFKDQRAADKVEELEQAGDEVLADQSFGAVAVQVVPMEDSAMPYGTAWRMGDRVAVVVEGQELASTVTSYTLKADADGFRLGAVLGDASGFDPQAALSKRVSSVEDRVSSLERSGAATAPIISVGNRDLGTAQPGWNTFTVTLPGGASFPNSAYTVTGHAHEMPINFGSAVFTTAEAIPVSPTQFRVRVNNNYTRELPCLLDYIAVQNT